MINGTEESEKGIKIINQNNKSVKGKVREINVYLVFFGIFLNNLWTRVLKSVIIILET